MDLRRFREAPQRARLADEYPNAVATIAAFVTRVEKDQLFSEHIERRRRWVRGVVTTAVLNLGLAVIAAVQTASEYAETKRAIEGEELTRSLRDISDVVRRATWARLHAQEHPDLALAEAAQYWRRAEPSTDLADSSLEDIAREACAGSASALSTVLRAHPGLVGNLHKAHGAAQAVSANLRSITAYDSTGHALRSDLSSPGQPSTQANATDDEQSGWGASSVEMPPLSLFAVRQLRFRPTSRQRRAPQRETRGALGRGVTTESG